LVVLYYQATKAFDKINLDKEKDKLAKTQAKYGLNTLFFLILCFCGVFVFHLRIKKKRLINSLFYIYDDLERMLLFCQILI